MYRIQLPKNANVRVVAENVKSAKTGPALPIQLRTNVKVARADAANAKSVKTEPVFKPGLKQISFPPDQGQKMVLRMQIIKPDVPPWSQSLRDVFRKQQKT